MNHLGSITEATNNSGSVLGEIAYDPWGVSKQLQGSYVPDFVYAGYYLHARSGLNLTLHRAYSSSLGRFINRDPIEEKAGLNLFAYVDNEPINLSDSSGLCAQWVPHNQWGSQGADPNAGDGDGGWQPPPPPPGIPPYNPGGGGGQGGGNENPDPCPALLRAMDALGRELVERYLDILVDEADLYIFAQFFPNIPMTGTHTTFAGHLSLAFERRRQFRELIRQADRLGCKVPRWARLLATENVPTAPLRHGGP